ncbi:hypothetical protein EV385_0138 [Krasilnikovia cinnamomea]|uniref:Uncharacterized protein n=1 Tax=Krasilnikovia cinnamomea TaxID=349313 RepID=A0A4Q7ZDU1_9ACTN|nr:hypothetical protein [Krasilnikovia cinnamomea]RZU48424.1 hypothetical protein EV385_0138 [Krasilnikovia cinnamomea]
MTRLRGTWTAAAVTLFLLSACARTTAGPAAEDAAASGASGSPTAPAGDALVLRVEHYGGFAGGNQRAGRIPDVSAYADGRVITQGPQVAIYPGPALPNLVVLQTSPERVTELARKAQDSGVRSGVELGRPTVSDATTTRITVATDGAKYSVDAYALSEGQPQDATLTPAQNAARAKLSEFVQELTDLSTATGTAKPQPYVAQRVAVLASPWVKPGNDLPKQPGPQAWPGPALPGEYLVPAVKQGCQTVTGSEAQAVLAAAAKANANTPWVSGGEQWRVSFRPLLPDEPGCAALRTRQ